jgi:predicted 2-oxoglutarate/Fe(II)-dependent dioxygenase YbiX
MLPVHLKPKIDYEFSKFVTEIPNALSIHQINRLRQYANSDISGWHRRGSKDAHTVASFYTCQVHPLHDELYEILDPLWEPYKNVTFIEPYEIKSYVEGDLFEPHHDAYFNLDKCVDRKLNLIIQMSDSTEYDGGELMIGNHVCSKTQGTAVIFPASLMHWVTKITRGNRYSLIGHGWGPYHI